MMLGTSICAFIIVMSATLFGIPISTSHIIVGATIGAGLAALSSNEIDWWKLFKIGLSWVVSPLVACLAAFLLLLLICWLTLDLDNGKMLNSRLLWATCISACGFSLVSGLFLLLLQDSRAMVPDPLALSITMASGFLFGGLQCRWIVLAILFGSKNILKSCATTSLLFKFWDMSFADKILQRVNDYKEDQRQG